MMGLFFLPGGRMTLECTIMEENAFANVRGRVEDCNLPLPQDKIDISNPGSHPGSAEEFQERWRLNVGT